MGKCCHELIHLMNTTLGYTVQLLTFITIFFWMNTIVIPLIHTVSSHIFHTREYIIVSSETRWRLELLQHCIFFSFLFNNLLFTRRRTSKFSRLFHRTVSVLKHHIIYTNKLCSIIHSVHRYWNCTPVWSEASYSVIVNRAFLCSVD